MNVLIGCEYSGVVREAFAKRGHNAWSCDLLPSDQPTDKHYQGDIFDFIDGDWDLAIFHPPCTDLAISGAAHFKEKIKDGRQQRAIEFVERLYKCDIPLICIENPVGVLSTKSKLGKPTNMSSPMSMDITKLKRLGFGYVVLIHSSQQISRLKRAYLRR